MALLPESWKHPGRSGSTGCGDDGPSGEQLFSSPGYLSASVRASLSLSSLRREREVVK